MQNRRLVVGKKTPVWCLNGEYAIGPTPWDAFGVGMTYFGLDRVIKVDRVKDLSDRIVIDSDGTVLPRNFYTIEIAKLTRTGKQSISIGNRTYTVVIKYVDATRVMLKG